jgi:3-isopropylmalate/(R)-2-methylmalate dehydratase small subunit
VISSFFADIFKNNCLNVGVLPVQVSEPFLAEIFSEIEKDPNTEIKVDLIKQEVSLLSTGSMEKFDINSYKKENMLNGFDDIDYLQNMKDEIVQFADQRPI